MNVLIVGGAGFIGSNLAFKLLENEGVKIRLYDSLEPRFLSSFEPFENDSDRIECIQGDIRDEARLSKAVVGVDLVFYCAAQTSHPLSIREPMFDAEINCVGTLSFLECMRKYNREAMVVYTSSTTVVGGSELLDIDEDCPENPLDLYSAHKGVGEKYFRIYANLHGIRSVILRFPNLFGPYGKGDAQFGFINYFIELAQKGKTIPIYGAGQQQRCVLFIEDAVELMWQATQIPKMIGETFFAVGDEHRSVAEIANAIVKVFERGEVSHTAWQETTKRMDVGNVHFSSAKLRQFSDWKPRFDLESGLERTKEVSGFSLCRV